jgi:membrane protein
VKRRLQRAIGRAKDTHAYRSYQRYNAARGGLMAGGIAFFAFFSIFPALTLGFAVFGFVLRGHPSLFHSVVDSVSSTLPGIVKDSTHPDGVIDATKPPAPDVLTITGAVSAVVLLMSGLGWMGALREGIRAMFGQPLLKANPVASRARDLGVLVLLGLSMLASAVLSGLVNTTTDTVLSWLGASPDSVPGRVVLPLVGFVVVLAVDTAIFMVLLRLLSGVPLPWAALWPASLLGAAGVGVLKVAVSYGIVGSSSNPLLASFAILVGLLIVMNLMSRVTLVAASWAALAFGLQPRASAAPAAPTAPAAAAVRGARLPHPAEMAPTFGTRSADRTAIAAGAVLGAAAALGAGALRRAAGSVVALARRRCPAGQPAGAPAMAGGATIRPTGVATLPCANAQSSRAAAGFQPAWLSPSSVTR